jgi:UDP-N-acetylmuramoylalanine--D-glutamate ligase
MDLAGKKVVVVGLAQTGISVARFCHSRGASVIVTDAKPREAIEERARQVEDIATLELGGHNTDSFTSADYVVMSPGVPELPEMAAARAAGVEVIAEIELAYRCLDPGATLIAITGTNGKSTTTALCGSLCDASGRPTFCGGNLGNHPMIEAVDHPANSPGGLIVVEVAGFMLETCTSFRPKVAACLNITEDHLDRYGTMEVYASMKTRVFEWQTADDFSIANARCELTMAGARAASAKLFTFDSGATVERGAQLVEGSSTIELRLEDKVERYPAADLTIVGNHNLENAMAAYLAARLAGVEPDAIRRGAQSFRPQKHRMELVGRMDDIVFYDDSKGTNVAAVAASMHGFPRPVVLIAGGVDKGGAYDAMFAELDHVARALVLIGQATPIISKAAAEHGVSYPVVEATTMDDAVQRAIGLAQSGDAIVLSPACSSYDMFKNFGERGMAFRAALTAAGARRVD